MRPQDPQTWSSGASNSALYSVLMYNKTLWAIDNELSPRKFERLATDLLCRNGFPDITPVEGPRDRGRDSEIRLFRSLGKSGSTTFFQYSTERKWKSKLRREWRKVRQYGHQPDLYVFVTNQSVSGEELDALRTEASNEYGWELNIYSREWLRLQLEIANPDLALRYLGILQPEAPVTPESTEAGEALIGDLRGAARNALESKDYNLAISLLQRYLEKNPQSVPAWRGMAWAQYMLHQYESALASISAALGLREHDANSKSIRGCILTEWGIRDGDHSRVEKGREIFAGLVDESSSWMQHYNYANALSALNEHDKAAEHFRIATSLAPDSVMVWKNLASAYHQMGDHVKERDCLERALSIDPNHSIALVSKGVSELVDWGEPSRAITYIKRALEADRELGIRWPSAWYWLAKAYWEMGDAAEALAHTDHGLEVAPGNSAILRLKRLILDEEWRKCERMRQTARELFEHELTSQPYDYAARMTLAEIAALEEREADAWDLVDECFELFDLGSSSILRSTGFTLRQSLEALKHLPSYKQFRDHVPVLKYWDVSDPIFGLAETPPTNSAFIEALTICASIPYGLAYPLMAGDDTELRAAKHAHAVICEGLKECIPRIAAYFGQDVKRDLPQEVLVDYVSLVICFAGLVALRESSCQFGWIGGNLGVDSKILDQALAERDCSDIQRSVTSQAFIELNKVVGLVADE